MAALLLELPLEVLPGVLFLQLDFHDLIHVAETCKRIRHGDGGLETVELPTKSPVALVLCEAAFPRPELIPSTRPIGCSESWNAFLARCVRQRCCREAPPIVAGYVQSLFVDATGFLLASGIDASGHGQVRLISTVPTPVIAMAGVRVRSVALGYGHRLAIGCDGRVYSWGANGRGQLGLGDRRARRAPVLVEGLEGVRCIASAYDRSLAVTLSGVLNRWGRAFVPGRKDLRCSTIVKGFGGVRVRHGCAGKDVAFAIGEAGELYSWGQGGCGTLGHGNRLDKPSHKRVEALRGVPVSSVAVGVCHALALTESGLVYAWGENSKRALLGNPHAERELLPKPVEALRGVGVGSVAAKGHRSYAVADTGELWAWGLNHKGATPLGHGERMRCPLPKPIESLRGIKVDALAADDDHTLALADDGSVYAWGSEAAAKLGALGLGPSVQFAGRAVRTPQRVPALRVADWL
jgi:alpha-tubulin suppressor-like RCC1 family protein